MSGRKVQPPTVREPFVDDNRCLTPYGQRLLWDNWQRAGGFNDDVYDGRFSGEIGDANLAQVADDAREALEGVTRLDAQVESGAAEAQDVEQRLARREAFLRAQMQADTTENLFQQVEDLLRLVSVVRAQVEALRGDDTGATVGNLAKVASTGAYSDLTGRPTLGTAAAAAIGTAGTTVPLLDGDNTHSGKTAFSKPVILPSFTAAGLPAAGSYANAVAIVTDATLPTAGAVVVGGGTVRTIVESDGTDWRT